MGISSGAVQTKKSSYGMSALPVTNAIVYFNWILSQLLTSFEYQGDTKRIDIVKQASPVAGTTLTSRGLTTSN
ncbi:Putative transposase (identified by ISEscan HMM) [Klebsiella pneumoniae]|nr:Putative transposase (identified by ISEscan HMM) [Klebsiella pneumoniae]